MSLATRLYDVLTPEEVSNMEAMRRTAARFSRMGASGAEFIVPPESFEAQARLYADATRTIERLADIVVNGPADDEDEDA